MLPEFLERTGPLVQRPDGLCIQAIVHVAPLSPRSNQPDVLEHGKVLGHGGLLHLKREDDLVDGTFLQREEIENVAAARFGHSVEGVGSGSSSCHVLNIFPYGNMSRTICPVILHAAKYDSPECILRFVRSLWVSCAQNRSRENCSGCGSGLFLRIDGRGSTGGQGRGGDRDPRRQTRGCGCRKGAEESGASDS